MAKVFIACLPLSLFVLALLARRGAVLSSLLGIGAVFLLTFFSPAYAFKKEVFFSYDVPVILILTLSVALVIFPGQAMNMLLRQAGIIQQIGMFVSRINMPKLRLSALIVLGLAPALESLTGFGVSLFLTTPLLIHLFPLERALLLSLLSMNIMPWGTLSLATSLGAHLSGLSLNTLAYQTSLTSFFVFPTLGGILSFFCRKETTDTLIERLYPVGIGFSLSFFLLFYNWLGLSELSGVYAGLSTATFGFLGEYLWGRKPLFSDQKTESPEFFRLFFPYFLLIVLASLSRIESVHAYLLSLYTFKTQDLSFAPFASPGLFISLTILGVWLSSTSLRKTPPFLIEGIKRGFSPVLGIFMFLFFAQLQRSAGILQGLITKNSELSLTQNLFLSPLFGMLSGYMTGSNVGGNTLLMPLQSILGNFFQKNEIFAALQNSSAGHAVFMSIPIGLLIFSIARGEQEIDPTLQHTITKKILLCAPFIYSAILLALWSMFYLW